MNSDCNHFIAAVKTDRKSIYRVNKSFNFTPSLELKKRSHFLSIIMSTNDKKVGRANCTRLHRTADQSPSTIVC